jgi:hypothetical protein
MGNWLVARFTLSDVTFQNWMMAALALVLVATLITWWSERLRTPQLSASLISRPAEKLIYLMSAGPRQVWVWGSRI